MIALLLALMFAGQAGTLPPPPAKPPVVAPAAAQTPAKAPPPPAEPVNPAAAPAPAAVAEELKAVRLEALMTSLKGKPQQVFTARLGPPDSIKQATDGQVLFWTIALTGETKCAANAAGELSCARVNSGSCAIAAAFKAETGLSIWKLGGYLPACDKAADLLKPAAG